MAPPNRKIVRGELYWGWLDPVFGRETGGFKYRPCLVVSIDDINSGTGLITIVPGTSTPQPARWNCVRIENTPTNGLKEPTYFLSHQVRAVEVGRLAEQIGDVSTDDLAKVREHLGRCLGII